MKKITLSVLALLLFVTSYSQTQNDDQDQRKTIFGARLGYSSSFDTNLLQDGLRESSLYFGGFMETRLSEKWSFQVELNIIMDDTAFKDLINTEFETPLLFKYRLNEKVSLYAGPQIDNYLLKSHVSFQLSGVIGTQINLSKKFFIDARYNFRFPNGNVSERFRAFRQKSDLEIGVGFKF